VKVVFAGTPATAVPSLRAVAESRHELVAVVTRPDAPAGRGRKLVASPVAAYAEQLGLDVLKPEKPRDPEFLDRLREIAPDCCPVVAYGGLLPQDALDIPPRGWVNLHFSVLPAWRGAAPVQHAIIAGDDVTGASTFRIVKELDAGPVYGVLTEPIGPSDTAGVLLDRLAHSGARLLVDTLDGIEAGVLRAEPQPADGSSYAPKLTVEDAHLDLTAPAQRIDRLVRGCNPAPGAWTTLGGKTLQVFDARKHPFRRFAEVPGKIGGVSDVTAESFKVTAQGGRIEVLKARLEDGKKIGGGELAQAGGLSKDSLLGG
jgi:methionyl-tRNA formyltransferase